MHSKRDVLFIYTNINAFHSDTYSFGIAYLSSVLKNNGFSTMLEIVKSKDDYERVLRTVLEYRPKVVGFTSVSSQFVFVFDLAKKIRDIYECVIVCGGVHPTIFPDCIFSAPSFDGFFIGESEFSFLDFVSKVVKKDNYKDVDNFYYLCGSKLIKNRLKPRINSLAELPFPDRDIYNYQSMIDEDNGVARIMTSRGCPFNCTYCSNHAIARAYENNKNIIRYNTVEKSMAEIEMLKSKYKFDKLWFMDDLFILNREWLDVFLHEYKKRFDIPFMCQIRPNVCTRDAIFKLKEAGCYKIFLAVESANDYIRNVVMKRNITKTQLENTFKWAKEAGIETLSVNIIGVPGETEATIMETIDFNRRMNPTIAGVNIYSPYEGTELGDYCRKEGLIRDTNLHRFFDRRQSRLVLPTISSSKLMRLYDRFQYLVYKDVDLEKSRQFLLEMWVKRYIKLENNILYGFLFKFIRKIKIARLARFIYKKMLFNRI